MNIFKEAAKRARAIAIDVQDNRSEWKVGDPIRFQDQWRPGVFIIGIVTEVNDMEVAGHQNLRVKPITEKGTRRECTVSTCFASRP